jgi:hypothetical protein
MLERCMSENAQMATTQSAMRNTFNILEAKFDWSNILIGWKMEVQDFAI